MKGQKYMIISIHVEKVLDQKKSFHDKNAQQNWYRRETTQHNKGHIQQMRLTSYSLVKSGKLSI